MKFFKLWILVGGNGRNIGKTTLAEMLINNLSSFGPVVGIKISNIKPGGMKFHGYHEEKSDANFFIWEETKSSNEKDSRRFLKAGAKRSFFIQTDDENLEEAFHGILDYLDGDEMVVCESNGLRNFMKPAVFLMIKGKDNQNPKDYVERFLEMADYVLNPMDMDQFEKLSKSTVWEDGQIKFTIENN